MSFSHRHLSAFVTVAALHSLGRAAEQMHITQPALSRIIRTLEETLGARLFDRHPTGMILTAHGRAFLPRAELMLADWEAAIEEQRGISAMTTGKLRIGCVAGAVEPFLKRAMALMLQRYPNLHISVLDAIEDRLIDALVAGQIDFAVGSDIEGWRGLNLRQTLFAQDPWQIFVRPSHPLLRRDSVSIEALVDYRWVMTPDESIASARLRSVFRKHGLPPPDYAVETRSITVAIAALDVADYVTLMPEALLRSEAALGHLVRLPMPQLDWSRELFLYRRDKGSLSPSAREFLAILGQDTPAGG